MTHAVALLIDSHAAFTGVQVRCLPLPRLSWLRLNSSHRCASFRHTDASGSSWPLPRSSAQQGFTRRELAMASEVAEEGRGLVLVLNKFDLVPPDKRSEFLESVRDMMRRHLPQLPGLPLIPMSAATGEVALQLERQEEAHLQMHLKNSASELFSCRDACCVPGCCVCSNRQRQPE